MILFHEELLDFRLNSSGMAKLPKTTVQEEVNRHGDPFIETIPRNLKIRDLLLSVKGQYAIAI
jgi:hypothetical protein